MRKQLTPPVGDSAFLDERPLSEDPPETRTEGQRDRDRILYSSALQRLGGITQVSPPESGYAFHTRLIHSVKVAQVAQRIAQRLKAQAGAGVVKETLDALDVDAVEAAGLAHDLGHPPFGHIAETELKRLAVEAELDGFEGNAQSFRILTRLGTAGPFTAKSTGLNLTRRTLNGTLKYPWLRNSEDTNRKDKWGAYPPDSECFAWVRRDWPADQEVTRSLEAEIMDWADDVTYAVHDVDDFYRAGLIPLDRLRSDREELQRFQDYMGSKERIDADVIAAAERLYGDNLGLGIADPYEGRLEQRAGLQAAGGGLIGRYVQSATVIEDGGGVFFSIPDEVVCEVGMLKQLTWFYVIDRPSLAIIQEGQRRVIRTLFESYRDGIEHRQYRLFPPGYVERLEAAATDPAKVRAVIDLIAGLTEAAAVQIYQRLCGNATGSLLGAAGQLP
jgi:dGTPase